jgi:hypothetical protein
MMAKLMTLKPKRPKNLRTVQMLSPYVFGESSPTGDNNRWKTIWRPTGIHYLSAHPAARQGVEPVRSQGKSLVRPKPAYTYLCPNRDRVGRCQGAVS